MLNFGSFIKNQRELRAWTQTDLGAKLGINSSAISRIEKGTKKLSAKKLNLISEVFDIDLIEVKEIYFADKIANELYENNCSESVFVVAEKNMKYLKQKNQKQSQLKKKHNLNIVFE